MYLTVGVLFSQSFSFRNADDEANASIKTAAALVKFI